MSVIVGYICVPCNHLMSVFDYESIVNKGCDHAWDPVVLLATMERETVKVTHHSLCRANNGKPEDCHCEQGLKQMMRGDEG